MYSKEEQKLDGETDFGLMSKGVRIRIARDTGEANGWVTTYLNT